MLSRMPVDIVRRYRGKGVSSKKLRQVALRILQLLGRHESELSLALVGNAEMQQLNAKYRKKDYATDVLSFPAETRLPQEQRLLGDVVISIEKARQQAREREHSLDQEIITLLIHGILHLLGYHHERSERDERIMKRLEKKIYLTLCDEALISL